LCGNNWRPTRAAAGPVGHRTHGLFASAAAQPAGRESPPAIFDSMAVAQYPAILGAGAPGGAPTRGPRRFAPRSKTGHVVEVRLPEEIRPERLNGTESRAAVAVKEDGSGAGAAIHIEEADFLQNTTPRKAIHARERGLCFTVCAGPHPGSSAWITSCRGAVGMQFLPQPGLELHRMQLAERREAGGRFSPAALPRGPLERQRTRRPPPCSRRPGHRQTTPCCARKWKIEIGKGRGEDSNRRNPHP
jgi:hypothetical protein